MSTGNSDTIGDKSFKQQASKLDVDIDDRLDINAHKTVIQANIGGRRSDDKKPPAACGTLCPVMATSLKQTQRYTTVIVMICGLLMAQIITLAYSIHVEDSLKAVPDKIAAAIDDKTARQLAEHRLYVEKLIRDFENRKLTGEIAKEMTSMKSEVMQAIKGVKVTN